MKEEKKKSTAQLVGRRGQVTRRDIEIVRWVGRVRCATAHQVAERFGISHKKVYERLPLLEDRGLIARSRLLHHQPAVCHATKAGLALAGLGHLGVPAVTLNGLTHDLAIVAEQIQLELSGCEVVTEREMRAAQFVGDESFAVRVPPAPGWPHQSSHLPDLVFRQGESSWLAVEVELAPKSEARLRRILTAYVDAPSVERVIYAVPTLAFGARIRRIAEAVGVSGERLNIVLCTGTVAA